VPGLIFAKVKPVQALKKGVFRLKNPAILRGGFIIFQFGLTIALIISQLFIYKQIVEMKNADLGFDNNNLTAIRVNSIEANYQEKYRNAKLYKAELEKYGAEFGISRGTISENVPGHYFQNSFVVNPIDAVIDECVVKSTAVDEDYLKVYKIQMAEGRFFSEDFNTDSHAFIINETAMRKFIKLEHGGNPQPVVGVMKDIVISTLKNPNAPMIFRYGQHNNFPGYLTFRINPEMREPAIKFMEKTWANMFPVAPFDYLDVKETYYKNYESEKVLAQIITIFSLFALALSMLGLLGMISFTSEMRTKEIGIRKVNGARISEILTMLNRDFIKWVAIAFVIATPIAYYAMTKWLENFAYKTELSWWIFALAGLLALGIALLTVSWQSWKAATRNPVEALRYE
jgi:putative ABC transport system permease protein